MFHSIYFVPKGTDPRVIFNSNPSDRAKYKNTFEDWHLVAPSRPTIPMPTQKTKYIDIPGASGSLDFSTALTGYPVYDNREAEFEFYLMNDGDELYTSGANQIIDRTDNWVTVYSDLANYLNGSEFSVIFEDDMEYYYEGRAIVSSFDSTYPWNTVKIKINVYPYKNAFHIYTLPKQSDVYYTVPNENGNKRTIIVSSEYIYIHPTEIGNTTWLYPTYGVGIEGNNARISFNKTRLREYSLDNDNDIRALKDKKIKLRNKTSGYWYPECTINNVEIRNNNLIMLAFEWMGASEDLQYIFESNSKFNNMIDVIAFGKEYEVIGAHTVPQFDVIPLDDAIINTLTYGGKTYPLRSGMNVFNDIILNSNDKYEFIFYGNMRVKITMQARRL